MSAVALKLDLGHEQPEAVGAVGEIPDHLLAGFAARSAERDSKRELPFADIEVLKALRFGARRLPSPARSGASLRDVIATVIRLAAADSNIAHIWRNHFMLAERFIVHSSVNPFLAELRDSVAAGALIGLAGSEAAPTQVGGPNSFASRVVTSGGGYRFTARKIYSTGTIFADWIVTYGELEDGTRVNLIVPSNRKGVERIDDWDGMGQRLTGTGTTLFNDVEVAPNEVIRPGDIHPRLQTFSSSIAQLFLTAVNAGIVASVARDATKILETRDRTFYFAPTEAAKEDPILLASLGERHADAFAAEAIVLAAAHRLDGAAEAIRRGDDAEAETQEAALAAAKAKVSVDAIGQRAASAIYDVAGASATLRSRNLDRHWRNLRTVASHNPAAYKALAIGDRVLNGTPLPSLGFF